MKVKLSKIVVINFFGILILYSFLFLIFPINSNYFECNELISGSLFNSAIKYYIPQSCDQSLYMIGVKDFNSIITFDYNYQTRPLYILTVKFIYNSLNLLIYNKNILEFISFIFTHLLIVSFSTKYFLESLYQFNIQFRKYSFYLINFFILLTPILKWGIFDASHQTLIFLQYNLCLYFLTKKFKSYKSIYSYSFILGVLMLSNMTFALPFLFLIVNKVNSYKKFINNFLKNFVSGILLLLPIIFWRSYIYSEGFIPYNAATTYWKQFIWIKDFLLAGYENVNFNIEASEYYCMSVPLFLKCYLFDLIKSVYYLLFPLLLCLTSYKFINYENLKIYKSLLNKLISISAVSFAFWSLIGWYPPLRFNLYSLAPITTLLFCIGYLLINDKNINILLALTYILYFLFLNHWNFPDIIRFNSGIFLSYFIYLGLIYKILKLKK